MELDIVLLQKVCRVFICDFINFFNFYLNFFYNWICFWGKSNLIWKTSTEALYPTLTVNLDTTYEKKENLILLYVTNAEAKSDVISIGSI